MSPKVTFVNSDTMVSDWSDLDAKREPRPMQVADIDRNFLLSNAR